MAYLIKQEFFNGYFCPCCIRTWDRDDEWVQDREDALSRVQEDGTQPSDFDIIGTEVYDGATGEIIAQGKLEWPDTKYDKYVGNWVQRWHGHRDGQPFEVIWLSNSMKEKIGKDNPTWVEILDYLELEHRTKQREAAQKALEEAQAKLREIE